MGCRKRYLTFPWCGMNSREFYLLCTFNGLQQQQDVLALVHLFLEASDGWSGLLNVISRISAWQAVGCLRNVMMHVLV